MKIYTKKSGEKKTTSTWQFFVPFLRWLSDPFQWLSDLQLEDVMKRSL